MPDHPTLTVALAAKLLRWRREGRTLDEIALRTGMTPDDLAVMYGALGAPAPVHEDDQLPEELRVAPPAKPNDWQKHYGKEPKR